MTRLSRAGLTVSGHGRTTSGKNIMQEMRQVRTF
jgi:hypothetical protein